MIVGRVPRELSKFSMAGGGLIECEVHVTGRRKRQLSNFHS